MRRATTSALKYCGALGSCAAIALCTLYVTRPTAQGRPQADTVANASNASPIYLGKALALFSKADGLAGEPIGVDSLLPGRRKRSICGQGLKKVRRDGRLGIRRLEEWQTWQ